MSHQIMDRSSDFSVDAADRETEQVYDVCIVGAGPIGLELAVCLKQAGLNIVHFDAKQIGYTMSWWPRNTPFFSTTERLAIAGLPIQNNHQQRITGEDYLAYLRGVVEYFDLRINTYEPVTAIEQAPYGFAIATQKADAQHALQGKTAGAGRG